MTLEKTLHYSFKDKALLELALSHPSLPTKRGALPRNNQRLEFLGDAVLGMAVAEILYTMYPHENEGDLAKRYAALVCGEELTKIAKELDLGAYLHMSSSESDSDGRNTASNLEDACEALVGAIYLDGGFDAAKAFVTRFWAERAKTTTAPPKDSKTALQEWAQGRGLPLPEYKVVGQSGPSHAPEFEVEVLVKGMPPQQANAGSKKQAERAAAEKLLGSIRQ